MGAIALLTMSGKLFAICRVTRINKVLTQHSGSFAERAARKTVISSQAACKDAQVSPSGQKALLATSSSDDYGTSAQRELAKNSMICTTMLASLVPGIRHLRTWHSPAAHSSLEAPYPAGSLLEHPLSLPFRWNEYRAPANAAATTQQNTWFKSCLWCWHSHRMHSAFAWQRAVVLHPVHNKHTLPAAVKALQQ